MTREKAQAEARKRWGGRAYVTAGQHLSSPEKREAATAEFAEAKSRIDAIDAEIAERLKALGWFQELQAERRFMVTRKKESLGWRMYYKFQVGHADVGFHVEGQGDTWEEAFERADQKAKAVAS